MTPEERTAWLEQNPDFSPIPSEPHYAVSKSGFVFSFRRRRVLKPSTTYRMYVQVKLGKDRWRLIHRLVASTFIPNPLNKPHVNHIDGNTINNHCDNLEWVTQSENQLHAVRNGLQKPPAWTAESRAKLSASLRGRPHSEERKRNISLGRLRGSKKEIAK